ncbi:Hpt domain-containing protein [Thalassococcus sp. CAU 1522]|uniref:Hpt domain-containing protein n=1 Tax=Thalassococcus arenae TaxID=2851652 RepID=A0ABS6N613_9RHOB|nr:Hpt domain-containing protein [Thalassococcus arenae]MBV2359450.1 Hpt domain-containing protein [Thalassococcus arenae]
MIDWNRVRELRDEIGGADFDEVVDLFLAEVDNAIGGLQPEDTDAFRDQMHFLKGSALNLGFAALASLCADAECRPDTDPGRVAAQVATVFAESRSLFFADLANRLAA